MDGWMVDDDDDDHQFSKPGSLCSYLQKLCSYKMFGDVLLQAPHNMIN